MSFYRTIGDVSVGDGLPTVLMAELGTFFDKDVERGINFVERAVAGGADVIKTEILHDANVCLPDTRLMHEFNHAAGKSVIDYRQLIEKKIVPLAQYKKLIAACHTNKIPCVASVYDFVGIDFFKEQGGAGLKIARNNIQNYPLIKHAAKSGLPIIFDAGCVHLDEVLYAVRLAKENGANDIIINHHPGANPAPPERHHMNVIKTYKALHEGPIGLSCHYRGDEIIYLGIGLGINLIEKGVYDDPDKPEQDVVSAISFKELPTLATKIKRCWQALGEHLPVVNQPRDESVWPAVRTKQKLKKGDKITLETVDFSWPPLGISAKHWDLIEGKILNKDVDSCQSIYFSDIVF